MTWRQTAGTMGNEVTITDENEKTVARVSLAMPGDLALMTAAPELLLACEDALMDLQNTSAARYDVVNITVKLLRSAIAKAKAGR